MHRAKHRAGDRTGAADGSPVLATTLLERFAPVPGPRTRADRVPAEEHVLFGAAPLTAPMLAVPAADVLPDPAPEAPSDLFGAARHAARSRGRQAAVPAPRCAGDTLLADAPSADAPPPVVPAPTRSRPVSAAVTLTVFGAAAAVTSVVAPPPSAVESTGSLAPVQSPAPAPTDRVAVAPALAAPAAAALPDQPTMRVDDLVTHVTGEMAKVRPYTTVAHSESLTSSPAAMRKAAMTNALAKLGTPYRWGAMGPNAFDCSGLVKWSFANAGRSLPRTSRAMASVGVPVAKSDLQPGDLVFFYRPISHVGIYIGNGQIVHASRSGQPVKVSSIANMRFSAARRIV